jgi:hypothetical protein
LEPSPLVALVCLLAHRDKHLPLSLQFYRGNKIIGLRQIGTPFAGSHIACVTDEYVKHGGIRTSAQLRDLLHENRLDVRQFGTLRLREELVAGGPARVQRLEGGTFRRAPLADNVDPGSTRAWVPSATSGAGKSAVMLALASVRAISPSCRPLPQPVRRRLMDSCTTTREPLRCTHWCPTSSSCSGLGTPTRLAMEVLVLSKSAHLPQHG